MSTDLLVVGAGPAGVSAALWAATFRLTVHVLDAQPQVGGQLALIRFHPAELPGVAAGTGPELAAVYAAQLAAAGLTPQTGRVAAAIEDADVGVAVRTVDGARVEARALLIASGLRRRHLEVPGEREFEDRGVTYSARRDRDRFAGDDVLVVGGGDGAFENALLLTEVGCRVTLVVRGRVRARPEFRARVAADARIELLEHTRVVAFEGHDVLEAVRLERGAGEERLAVRGAVIKIGMVPNSAWCSGVALDSGGYVTADSRGRTSRPRVWAAGDVARPLVPSIAAAHGSAATAVADIRATLRGG